MNPTLKDLSLVRKLIGEADDMDILWDLCNDRMESSSLLDATDQRLTGLKLCIFLLIKLKVSSVLHFSGSRHTGTGTAKVEAARDRSTTLSFIVDVCGGFYITQWCHSLPIQTGTMNGLPCERYGRVGSG